MAVLTFLLFASTLGHGFVNWDDGVYVTANPATPLTSERLEWIFSHFYYYAYIPVTLLSHAVDRAVSGLDPRGHHLTNVLLHTGSALGVLWLGLLLLGTRPGRATSNGDAPFRTVRGGAIAGMTMAALLFAVHPLRAESVAWISDRKDLLCAFLLLPAVGAYLRYARGEHRARAWYAISLLLFLLAVLAKSVAVGLPVLLILLDALWLSRRNIADKAPFFLVSAVIVLVSLSQTHQALRAASVTGLTPVEAILLPFYSLGFSLWKTLAPWGLGPIYPRPDIAWMVAAAGLVVAVTALVLLAWRRGYPAPALAWASYGLFLLPNLVGLSSGMQPVADRYSYLATIGIFLLLGGAFAAAWDRGGTRRLLAAGIGAALVAGLASRTLAETPRWRSSIRLWESVTASEPASREYVDAYVNLGAAYVEAGRMPEARATLERAATIDSSRADVLYNLGMVQYAGGEGDRAASSLRRATDANPRDARAFYNLAIVLDELGRREEAVSAMREAARLGSRDAMEALSSMRPE